MLARGPEPLKTLFTLISGAEPLGPLPRHPWPYIPKNNVNLWRGTANRTKMSQVRILPEGKVDEERSMNLQSALSILARTVRITLKD